MLVPHRGCRRIAAVTTVLCIGACDSGSTNALDNPTLQLIDTIGSLAGDGDSFGLLLDAEYGDEGSIFVADALSREVVRLEAGQRVSTLGRRGAGPGEFRSPSRLATGGGYVAVHDEPGGRIVVFHSSGQPAGGWPLSIPIIEDLEANDSIVVVSSGFEGATRVVAYTWDGSVVGDTVVGAGDDRPIRGGQICLTDAGEMLYLDPSAAVLRTFSGGGDSVSTGFERPDGSQQPAILGVECNDSWAVASILHPDMSVVTYLLFRRSPLELVARRDFPRNDEGVVSGFGYVTDIRGDTLLTITTKPFSKISVVLIGQSRDAS